MPEIKNNFLKGRMNKDLDERLIPKGEYRDAMNIQVTTSEGSDIGTVQNILGNSLVSGNLVPSDCKCIGAIADEKNDKLYWFVKREFNANHINFEAILEYSVEHGIVPVLVDTKVGTPEAVLKFPNKIITGINIINNLLLWTDGVNEPRRIDIQRCIKGTPIDALTNGNHTQLSFEKGSFHGTTLTHVVNSPNDSVETHPITGENLTRDEFDKKGQVGRYGKFHLKDAEKTFNINFANSQGLFESSGFPASPDGCNVNVIQYRNGEEIYRGEIVVFHGQHNTTNWSMGPLLRRATPTPNYDEFAVGDVLFGDNITEDITEEHIVAIRKKPGKKLNVKINTTSNKSDDPIFEKIFPRFSYRYKYIDNQYSAIAPYTDVVFNPKNEKNSLGFIYNAQEATNTSMVNKIKSIELSNFILPDILSDVTQVDILYKQENSNVVYVIANIKYTDDEFHAPGTFQGDIPTMRRKWDTGNNAGGVAFNHLGDGHKGKYIVDSENIRAALPENQTLRPWDNLPRKALSQEITSSRVVYGNYTQGYNPETSIPNLIANYKNRGSYSLPYSSFEDGGLPSIKSQRNYQVGVVFGDKYGRETPVFTSSKSAIRVPWKNFNGVLSANQTNQIEAKLEKDPPSFAEYIKYFVKETSGEYYNLIMEKAYLPHDMTLSEMQHTLWLSFPSAERNKIEVDDYIILKKKIGSGQTQVLDKNRFKVIDIQNEAPDFVKFEYFSMGSASDVTDPGVLGDLFTNADARPTRGNTIIEIDKDEWLGDKCNGAVIAGGGSDEWSGDKDYLKGEMYMSWSRIIDNNTAYSSKYKIIDANVVGELVRLKIEKPISREDHFISTGTTGASTSLITDYAFQIEQRREKNNENFSGKFFVKVFSDPILKSSILDSNTNILSDYVISARRPCFYAADARLGAGGTDADNGSVNTQSYNVPSGGNNSPEEVHSSKLTNTPTRWGDVQAEIGTSNFFIDAMYMQAGQISDDNYARNSGQIWQGIHVEYPVNPEWDGRPVEMLNSTDPLQGGRVYSEYVYRFGWRAPKHASGQWYNDNTNDSSFAVNGLEGVITSDTNHTAKPYRDLFYNDQASYGNGLGIRRWKKEYAPGLGMYKAHLNPDNTYGEQDETGRFFIHLSILSPGEDLVDSTSGMGDSIYPGNNSIANGLQGIWGGGVFTKDNGELFGSYDDQSIVPMEGKTEYGDIQAQFQAAFQGENVIFSDSQDEAPGPDVKNSFGYDERYKERHENQWNPTWKKSDENAKEIQSFIDNLKIGKQFKFENDTNEEIYTIKKVSIKKLYNHTGWKKQLYWDGTVWQYDQGNDSVEKAVMAWANTVDSNGDHVSNNDNDNKLNNAKDTIRDFGRANNRRLCYIIEVDKNPKSSSYNPVDGSNIDLDTSSAIQFVEQATSFIEVNSEQPIIWETEPKESIDLDIYHEASDIIPVKLNTNTCEMFAPVGCRVENLNYNYTSSVVTRWITENEFEIKPGWQFLSAGGDEIDYSNTKVRFYRKDGSYVTALLSAQVSDPSNTLGAPSREFGPKPVTGTDTLRTRFYIDSNIGRNLEVGLSWYNCFSFGNGIESNRIRDGFNEMTISKGPIVSSTLESNYQEETRTSGLIYSGIYNSDTSVNDLNQFIMAEKITKDLNPTYGSIQKLFQRRVGLVAFCEDRIVDIVAGKDTLFNADGNPQLIASNKVLGTATPFVGDYGISKNPESFASESYRVYFTDKQRGAVLRLSMDGLTPISNIGMRDWFRDNLKMPNELIGTYDEYKKEYNITFTNNFTQNLLRNSFITAGEELVNLTPTAGNLISNGGIETGVGKTKTEIRLNGSNSSSWNNIAEHTLRYLDSETTIINHPPIIEGQYQAGVTAQAGIPEQDNTWGYGTQGVSTPLVEHVFGDVSQNNGSGSFGNGQTTVIRWDGGTNSSHFLGGPFRNNTDTDFGGNYVWGRSVKGLSAQTADDGETYHEMIWVGGENWASPEGVGFSSAFDIDRHLIGSVLNAAGGINNTGNTYSGMVFASGINGDTNSNNKYAVFPYTNSLPSFPSTGVGNITNWNPNHPAWNLEWNTGITNGQAIGDWSGVKETTAMYSEEFKVTLEVEGSIESGAYSTPNSSPPAGASYSAVKVIICDNNVPVDDSIIYQQNGGAFGDSNAGDHASHPNNAYNNYSLSTASIEGYDFSTSSLNTTEENTKKHMGYVGSNEVIWPDKIYGSFGVVTLTFYIKFRNPTQYQPFSSSGKHNQQGIAVDRLNFRVQPYTYSGDNKTHAMRLQSFKIEKLQTLTTPQYEGQTAVTGVPAIPPSLVVGWAEVSHSFPAPGAIASVTMFGNQNYWPYPSEYINHLEAISTYGEENPTTKASAVDVNGTLWEWDIPNPNGVTAYNDFGDGVIQNGSDRTRMTSISTMGTNFNGYITFDHDIPLLKTPGKWVMVDVITRNATLYAGSSTTNSGIAVRFLLDPNASPSSAHFNSVEWYSSSIEYGSFGTISNTPSGSINKEMYLLDPLDWPNYNELHGYNVIPIESNGYYTAGNVPAGSRLFRAIVKISPHSHNVVNNQGTLSIRFYGFDGEIDIINVRDISERETGGTAFDWDMDYNGSQSIVWSTSGPNNPPTSWKLPDYGGGDDAMTPHAFSQRRMFLQGNKMRFVNATGPGQIFYQRFHNITNPINLLPSQDIYEFKFVVDGFDPNGDTLKIAIASDRYMESVPGSGTIDQAYRLTMYVDEDGTYVTRFNFDGNIDSITKDGQSYVPNTNWTNDIYTGGNHNTILIMNENAYSVNFPNTQPSLMTCNLSGMRLSDISSIITGGTVDHWDFVGFDLDQYQYIYFENNQIKLDQAPDSTEIRQVVNKRIKENDYYRIRFNYSLTSGRIRVYYFTSESGVPQGFRTDVISFDDDNPTGVYDKVHRVGETYINHPNYLYWVAENLTTGIATDHFGGELVNTFVVQILEGEVNGELDNFFMQKALYIFNESSGQQEPYQTKTISFNEENKGWVSFKSFIPENGISVSNKYFTMLDGRLYEHYTADTTNGYNTFYDNFTPSQITSIFNDEPSMIKSFHTLNYEGSQSNLNNDGSIQGFDIITNDWEDYPPVSALNGWYAATIKNDSGYAKEFTYSDPNRGGETVTAVVEAGQMAEILEFKQKEGKWFSNIIGVRGVYNVPEGVVVDGEYGTSLVPSYGVSHEDFSVQGLGFVSQVDMNVEYGVDADEDDGVNGGGGFGDGGGIEGGGGGAAGGNGDGGGSSGPY